MTVVSDRRVTRKAQQHVRRVRHVARLARFEVGCEWDELSGSIQTMQVETVVRACHLHAGTKLVGTERHGDEVARGDRHHPPREQRMRLDVCSVDEVSAVHHHRLERQKELDDCVKRAKAESHV